VTICSCEGNRRSDASRQGFAASRAAARPRLVAAPVWGRLTKSSGRLAVLVAAEELPMFPKRKEPKRKSIAETLMRDIQGSAAEKLALFQKVKAAGGFANEDPAELKAAEDLLLTFAAREKMTD